MALNSLHCAEVPLRNYSLSYSITRFVYAQVREKSIEIEPSTSIAELEQPTAVAESVHKLHELPSEPPTISTPLLLPSTPPQLAVQSPTVRRVGAPRKGEDEPVSVKKNFSYIFFYFFKQKCVFNVSLSSQRFFHVGQQFQNSSYNNLQLKETCFL